MTRQGIQSSIKDILEDIPNIGIVHDSLRWSVYQDNWLESFVMELEGQSQVRTWMIYRSSGGMDYGSRQNSIGTGLDLPTRSSLRRYDFKIEGWTAFKDEETDEEFQLLVDTVLDKFEANISLNNSCIERGPIAYDVDHQFFGEHFVHHIIINFYASERSGITPF